MKQLYEYKYFVAQVLLDAPVLTFLHTQYIFVKQSAAVSYINRQLYLFFPLPSHL